MDVVLVVPAYNEAERIGAMFADYLNYFDDTLGLHVVLNGCTDTTESVVQQWQTRYPKRISYEVHEKSYGKGWAVKKGFAAVQAPYVGYVDADGATPAREFQKLLEAVSQSDGAIASRYAPGAHIAHRVSWFRSVTGRLFRLIAKAIVRLPYDDTQCGAKVFPGHVVQTVAPAMRVNNMAFDIELLLLCAQHPYTITEVPTYWEEGKASTFITTKKKLLITAFRMLVTTIQLRFRFK